MLYLQALDQKIKFSHENTSILILHFILCEVNIDMAFAMHHV